MVTVSMPDGSSVEVSLNDIIRLFASWRWPVLRICGCPPRTEVERIIAGLKEREQDSGGLQEKMVLSRSWTIMLGLRGWAEYRVMLYYYWHEQCVGQVLNARRLLRLIATEVDELLGELASLRIRKIRQRSVELCRILAEARSWLRSDLKIHDRKERMAEWMAIVSGLDSSEPSTEELEVALRAVPRDLLEAGGGAPDGHAGAELELGEATGGRLRVEGSPGMGMLDGPEEGSRSTGADRSERGVSQEICEKDCGLIEGESSSYAGTVPESEGKVGTS